MRTGLLITACVACWATCLTVPCRGADWLLLPSTYSHDPTTGKRVSQYAPTPSPRAQVDPTYRSSGFRHTRSTLAYGQSADNYHRVERWGAPIRPYGEWRFPYRPYSTPYPNWGPPFGGLNVYPGFGVPVITNPPATGTPGTGTAPAVPNWQTPYPAGGTSPYPVAPYYDGYYPSYRQ